MQFNMRIRAENFTVANLSKLADLLHHKDLKGSKHLTFQYLPRS
ncbi:hypothetical protein RINTHH_16270 [Richelia intracellularis HH01]|uniref:Uncharacterized protein n=1 Tax=Richelia intracellularis HH01 TaxID=1165094 RepID=M1WZQ2_9NOST|nr:hypothetical protein RINTHH_16270 [Richelia intracellularis HH01]